MSNQKKSLRLKFLSKENDLNKILRQQKRTKERLHILFVSEWDGLCEGLVSKLRKKYEGNAEGTPLYVVNSFDMPHSFVIYKTTKLPHLVSLNSDKVKSEDWLSMIEKTLKV